jgi:NAD(P)-dependent dehydrogenase (short-subunit alcohol dehydrogenase family)
MNTSSFENLFNLNGRHALITGATQGIGRSIAHRLTQAGAEVILHCRNVRPELHALIDELSQINKQKPKFVIGDLRTPGICDEILRHSLDQVPHVDILINNAAIQPTASLQNISEKDIFDMLTINLATPLLLIKAFSKQKIESGAVVNISSIEAIRPAMDHSHYASTKAGLLNLTMSSALELGRKNIRVNSICPGLTERPGLEDDWPEGVKSWQDKVPLGRLCRGEDIANSALFLASDAASFITGACITVDGGISSVSGW